jgi:hypothetical protein
VARLGPCESFLILLRWAAANLPDIAAAAFADQDDVWLPEKLARALDALGREIDSACPALYCARQTLVDDALRPIGRSLPFRRVLGFPDSLTQNIATGATIMLNRAALSLIATVPPPRNGHHDWWSYLLVTAAGGKVVADDTPVLLYRQHDSNAVGAPASLPRRAQRAIRRGPDEFMGLFARHVAALSAADTALTPAARASLSELRRGLAGGMLARLRTLGKLDLRRRTWLETLVFRLWFVLGARVEGLPSDR